MVRVPGWKHWDRVMDGGVGLETLGQGDGCRCQVRNAGTG